MRLASLVISLDVAQRLLKFNINLVSCFYWYQEKLPDELQLFKTNMTQAAMPWKLNIGKPSKDNSNVSIELPAYCASELGEILPCSIKIGDDLYSIGYTFRGKEWEYSYVELYDLKEPISVKAATEQDARALLLIELFKTNYIIVSQTIIK